MSDYIDPSLEPDKEHYRPSRSRPQLRQTKREVLKLPSWEPRSYARGSSKGPSAKSAARRCVVKMTYAGNGQPSAWKKHGAYLEREGGQKEGEKGLGFGSAGETSIASTLDKWQNEQTPRLFKIVISPEDPLSSGALQALTRDLMKRAQQQTGQDFDWVAIDHSNTAHPHVHIVIKGDPEIHFAPDFIKQGLRNLASDALTEKLGYKTERELQKAMERQIVDKRLTPLDRRLATLTDDKNIVQTSNLRPPLKKRLEYLETLGLAHRSTFGHSYKLEDGFQDTLKELNLMRARTETIAKSRAILTDPRALPVLTKLQPKQVVVGRVLGTGLDDANMRDYILIEGTDGKAHIIYQTASIDKQRGLGNLQPRSLVAIEKTEKGYIKVTDYNVQIPDTGYASIRIPPEALLKGPNLEREPISGFAATYAKQRKNLQGLYQAKTKDGQTL